MHRVNLEPGPCESLTRNNPTAGPPESDLEETLLCLCQETGEFNPEPRLECFASVAAPALVKDGLMVFSSS
ncbi:hypothetical protein NDU88_007178 [Pleurodeles waltl]|uniref:Uncharacterized protein n=1 Tax=Pleurodeles waltl TaxID=8319 RepID=A0AAV7NSG6_PLEWA|nr:hypothetical protein NDU88_007178 [Pleurodeles waltl]